MHVTKDHEQKFLSFFDCKLGANKLKEEYEKHLKIISDREEEEEKKRVIKELEYEEC